jgi:hypothetical protein
MEILAIPTCVSELWISCDTLPKLRGVFYLSIEFSFEGHDFFMLEVYGSKSAISPAPSRPLPFVELPIHSAAFFQLLQRAGDKCLHKKTGKRRRFGEEIPRSEWSGR